MTVDELIAKLRALSNEGHGDAVVRYESDSDEAEISNDIELDATQKVVVLHPKS